MDLQLKAVTEAGVQLHRLFTDKSTGSHNDREGLNMLCLKVEPGGVILVTKLNWLERNTLDMVQLIEKFNKIGMSLRFPNNGITTKGAMEKLKTNINFNHLCYIFLENIW